MESTSQEKKWFVVSTGMLQRAEQPKTNDDFLKLARKKNEEGACVLWREDRMHKLRFPTTAAIAALSLGVFAGQARAADGLFLAGTGTIDKSFAGGGIANPEDASSLASNPAGLLTAGHEFVVNQGFVSPFTQYSSNGL